VNVANREISRPAGLCCGQVALEVAGVLLHERFCRGGHQDRHPSLQSPDAATGRATAVRTDEGMADAGRLDGEKVRLPG
jgi:hypothetical protein